MLHLRFRFNVTYLLLLQRYFSAPLLHRVLYGSEDSYFSRLLYLIQNIHSQVT